MEAKVLDVEAVEDDGSKLENVIGTEENGLEDELQQCNANILAGDPEKTLTNDNLENVDKLIDNGTVQNAKLADMMKKIYEREHLERADEDEYSKRKFYAESVDDCESSKEILDIGPKDFEGDATSTESDDKMLECASCYYRTIERRIAEMEYRHNAAKGFKSQLNRDFKATSKNLRSYDADKMCLVEWNDEVLTSIDDYGELEEEMNKISLSITQRFGELQTVSSQQNVLVEKMDIDKKELQTQYLRLEVDGATLDNLRSKHAVEVGVLVEEATSLLDVDFSAMTLGSISKMVDEKSAELEAMMADLGISFEYPDDFPDN